MVNANLGFRREWGDVDNAFDSSEVVGAALNEYGAIYAYKFHSISVQINQQRREWLDLPNDQLVNRNKRFVILGNVAVRNNAIRQHTYDLPAQYLTNNTFSLETLPRDLLEMSLHTTTVIGDRYHELLAHGHSCLAAVYGCIREHVALPM